MAESGREEIQTDLSLQSSGSVMAIDRKLAITKKRIESFNKLKRKRTERKSKYLTSSYAAV